MRCRVSIVILTHRSVNVEVVALSKRNRNVPILNAARPFANPATATHLHEYHRALSRRCRPKDVQQGPSSQDTTGNLTDIQLSYKMLYMRKATNISIRELQQNLKRVIARVERAVRDRWLLELLHVARELARGLGDQGSSGAVADSADYSCPCACRPCDPSGL